MRGALKQLAQILWGLLTSIALMVTVAGLFDEEIPLGTFKIAVGVLLLGTVSLLGLFDNDK